ncbi:hypothetical protein OFL98_23755, partial [Escherichia coli]|nr:hypothetical protein [Escherichia coli]
NCFKTGNADFWSRSAPKRKLTTAIDLGGSFTSLTISYDERSNSVILSLLIAIDSGVRRFENSIYNPFAEILIYNDPKAALTTKTSDKIEEDDEILKKFITRINKFINYNTISTEDYR